MLSYMLYFFYYILLRFLFFRARELKAIAYHTGTGLEVWQIPKMYFFFF
jgi:hypothetical protein